MSLATEPIIYNLFPRLVGSMDRWLEHLPRIRAMGFDWVYLNPFHYAGYSGSLYAVKNYYAFHPLFVNANLSTSPEEQFRTFLDAAHAQGLKVMMDLVINHTSFDSVLAEVHPEWFVQEESGRLKRPGCMDGDTWVEWGDLVQVNNVDGPDRQGLWSYWLDLVRHFIGQGIDGFRADAATQVPAELWRFLIPAIRWERPDILFFAETLGCRPWELIEAANCGFDYVFNSVRWWDYDQPWFLESHARVLGAAPMIGFPESHDTVRAADELEGSVVGLKQKYLFAALFSAGVLMPIGYEYGFTRRLDVVETYPENWEESALDLSAFIGLVNQLKASARIFNVDGPILPIPLTNPALRAYVKSSSDAREKVLFILNLDREHTQQLVLPSAADAVGTRFLRDVSPEGPWAFNNTPDADLIAEVAPGACQVLLGSLQP